MTLRNDLTGQKFGRWTVLHVIDEDRTGSKPVRYLCRCECGVERPVQYSNLIYGTSQSCGCLERETKRERTLKHGMTHSPLMDSWEHMKQRCLNPKNSKYSFYGGRGIKVCEEWMEFVPFMEWALANGYKNGLTIDRIDPNGNYEPSNCRWVDMEAQRRNTRRSLFIEYDGRVMNQVDWAKEFGCRQERVPFEILRREGRAKYGRETSVLQREG